MEVNRRPFTPQVPVLDERNYLSETPVPSYPRQIDHTEDSTAITTLLPNDSPSSLLEAYKPEEDLTLEQEIMDYYDDGVIKKVMRISYYLCAVGLSFEESCLLIREDPDKFAAFVSDHPLLQRWFQIKELEYKKDLMTTVSDKAKNGDDKMAMWLLEKRHPEQFGNLKKAASTEGRDALDMAIEFVRKTGAKSGLVNEESARIIVHRTTGAADLIKKVNDILK